MALLYFVLERYVRKPEMRVTGRARQAMTAFALIFYGGIVARDAIVLFSIMSPPAWAKLLSSATPLVLGLFFLTTARGDDGAYATRIFGGILIVIGAVTLAHDGYRYAISLGTAASVSLP
ncbi:hypothetical protein QH494_24115 [Sphingomonas sp. AR_OL41]|uniref:hypothetical protein n=1 Tax=Sphingomonas sp. AR_OL41 TaxID=3042729 RepID=UPI002480064E|nr:hypothetical protein [Sphingomonas sp. AR_OL41]MDH7975283.1 hypothetical protein [Sphingomonas sp. AR_OL41]